MYKILRIIFCVLAALCVAGCVFAFVYAGMVWGIAAIVAAAAFFALCVLFKKLQEDKEKKDGKNAGTFIGNAQDGEKTDDPNAQDGDKSDGQEADN